MIHAGDADGPCRPIVRSEKGSKSGLFVSLSARPWVGTIPYTTLDEAKVHLPHSKSWA
jgi:hypothetical protein